MVSQAGGAALKGLLPVVHSFACFLSDRPNEQIYNNATERTKVVYVGSLAGLVPGGPGHSHQCVRDIAALSAVPGLVMIEPSCEREVDLAVRFCLEGTSESCYLRLVSVPWDIPFELPARLLAAVRPRRDDHRRHGRGRVRLRPRAARRRPSRRRRCCASGTAVALSVVNLPWLNRIDADWFMAAVRDVPAIFTLDNHFIAGGQGDMLLRTLAERATDRVRIARRLGVVGVPVCGHERRGAARPRSRRREPVRHDGRGAPAEGDRLMGWAPQIRALKRVVRRVYPVKVDQPRWAGAARRRLRAPARARRVVARRRARASCSRRASGIRR